MRITDPFYMAKYETTIGQVLAFLNATDERRWIDFSSPACPVKRVARRYYMRTDEGECWGSLAQPMVEISWLGGNTFCLWLTGRSGVRVQLPTEAQWEYACRAGTDTVYSFGNVQWSLDEYARVDENFAGGTDTVGQRKPNAWGLYDMHGNAWEWCLDGRRTYTSSTQEDPRGPESTSRMFRGGHWDGIPEMARSAARYSISALKTTDGSGFRVAFTIPGPRR